MSLFTVSQYFSTKNGATSECFVSRRGAGGMDRIRERSRRVKEVIPEDSTVELEQAPEEDDEGELSMWSLISLSLSVFFDNYTISCNIIQ